MIFACLDKEKHTLAVDVLRSLCHLRRSRPWESQGAYPFEFLLASTDVTLWRQLLLALYDLFFLPVLFVVLWSRWSSQGDDHSLSSWRHFSLYLAVGIFPFLFLWPLVVFLSCLSGLSDGVCCLGFPIFDGHLLISSKYIRDPRLDITWSSHGRPLLWDPRLRVDSDPLVSRHSAYVIHDGWSHLTIPHLRVSQLVEKLSNIGLLSLRLIRLTWNNIFTRRRTNP